MLIVQHPMSKPSHMVFGYSVNSSNSLYRLPSPPPLAPGPSLLDDSDTRFLDSFFDGVGSDQYLANDPSDTRNYEWQDLPPDFLGTTSSFGPQIEPVTNDVQHLTYPEFRNPPGFILDSSSPSEDVLAAATLLRNGHSSHSTGQQGDRFMASLSQQQPMATLFNQGMVTTEHSPLRTISTRPEDYMRHTSMNEAIYGPPMSALSSSRPAISKSVEIKWGTDSGFTSGRRFVAPPNTLTMDEIEENIASQLECFQPGSNASTRPSSPASSKIPYLQERRLDRISETTQNDNKDGEWRSKKRKKSKGKEGAYDDEMDKAIGNKIPRKRRPKSVGAASDPQTMEPPPLQKKLKPTAISAPKIARENLTEDQKRENHIKSEQKRRTLIKEGFEDLNDLVPDLRGGGFSKSAVLIMAADWLEDLMNGNTRLKAQLAELEGRNSI